MIVLVLALSSPAVAGTGWRPAAGAAFGRGGLLTESARVEPDEFALSLTGMLADGENEAGLALVGSGSFAWDNRLRVDLSVPAWLFAQSGDFAGPASGDASLQAIVPFSRGSVAAAVIPRIGLPTATDAAGLEAGPSAALLLAVGGGDRLAWAAHVGPVLAPQRTLPTGAETGSGVAVAGVGAFAPKPAFRLGLEAAATAGINAASSADLLAFAQVRQDRGLALSVSGGRSLGPASPSSRLVATISYTPEREPADPDPDRDGIAEADACPNSPEDLDAFADTDGCPEADNDADTLADTTDTCPDAAGPASTGGCPDTDLDGRHDGTDRCPTLPGPIRERPDLADGCPKSAWATAKRIEVVRPVRFDLSGHLTDPGIVAELAAYLVLHPELGPIEVGAHMASGWSEEEALGLTRVRAERTVEVLVQCGVSGSRLTAVGYGTTRPIDTNRIPSGQARNERIEFLLPAGRTQIP